MTESTQPVSAAAERYLLLADISGYTAFMASVEREHGLDFSIGIPAGFAILGELLDAVVEGLTLTSRSPNSRATQSSRWLRRRPSTGGVAPFWVD